MKILGNRVLVSKVEEPKVAGEFETVNVVDSFVYKGRVEQDARLTILNDPVLISAGTVIYFAKYSPDTQDIEEAGKKYKVVRADDILAIV